MVGFELLMLDEFPLPRVLSGLLGSWTVGSENSRVWLRFFLALVQDRQVSYRHAATTRC